MELVAFMNMALHPCTLGSETLPYPQVTYLFKDSYQEITARNPTEIDLLLTRLRENRKLGVERIP